MFEIVLFEKGFDVLSLSEIDLFLSLELSPFFSINKFVLFIKILLKCKEILQFVDDLLIFLYSKRRKSLVDGENLIKEHF